MLVMSGVGTMHLTAVIGAGARFEYALLSCIPLAYLLKYYGYEMALRFTHATGKSVLEAYATAWRKLPIWFLLVAGALQSAFGQAGRSIVAGALLAYVVDERLGLDTPWVEGEAEILVYAMVVGVLAGAAVFGGRYGALETFTKVSAAALLTAVVFVYALQPAPLSAMTAFFALETPTGAWLTAAALLALLPTGIETSLQAAEWSKARNVGMSRIRPILEDAGMAPRFDPFRASLADLTIDTSRLPIHALEYSRRWFWVALWDLRAGLAASCLVTILLVLAAAAWLHPVAGIARATPIDMANALNGVGYGAVPIFTLAALLAAACAALLHMDGWARIAAACCRNLFRPTALLSGTASPALDAERRRRWCSEYNIYRAAVAYTLVASLAAVVLRPDPLWLIAAAAPAYLFSPVIFFLNVYYCFRVIPARDRPLRPSRLDAVFAWAAFAGFSAAAGLFVVRDLIGGA
jgi:Mn2+/Fe2+ NRAMP family transporter